MQLAYKIGLAAAAAGLLLATSLLLVHVGYQDGVADTKAQWQAETIKRNAAVDKLKGEYAQKEREHTAKIQELTNDLAQAEQDHQANLNQFKLDYDRRLQLSTGRANVYQRQAAGSAVERDRLAKHAAELDRSLEQGRGLVRELRETLGQRDATIRELAKLIQSDRALMSNSNE